MKRFASLISIILLAFAVNAFAQGSKLEDLTAIASPANSDILYVVIPGDGDPNRKWAISDFRTFVNTFAQPLDSDLTAIAALSTAAYGRSILTTANEAAFKALVNLEEIDIQNTPGRLVTVATLPATPVANQRVTVTDALTTTSCTQAGGTNWVDCRHSSVSLTWEPTFAGGAGSQSIQSAANIGREISDAVDISTCFRVGNGVNPWCLYTDSANRARFHPLQPSDWVIQLDSGKKLLVYSSANALLAEIDEATGAVKFNSVAAGAAGGKKVLCIDETTKVLYMSSSDTACAN